FFFFFQAEDGIRDRNVTGVQTCALPILPLIPRRSVCRRHKSWRTLFDSSSSFCLRWRWSVCFLLASLSAGRGIDVFHRRQLHQRSEERRVGKECRSRWWV